MIKIITTVVTTVVLALLAFNNSDSVEVHFLIGQPFQMRLIFVMIICGAAGFVTRHIVGVLREEELNRRILMERKRSKRRLHPRKNIETDHDDFKNER